jgi:hypothetical protein
MRIMELCRIFRLVVEYLHHFDEDQDPDPHLSDVNPQSWWSEYLLAALFLSMTISGFRGFSVS